MKKTLLTFLSLSFLSLGACNNTNSLPNQNLVNNNVTAQRITTNPLKAGLIENISKARSGYSLTLINDNQKTNIAVNLFSESYIVNGESFKDYKKLLEVLNNSVNPRSLDFDRNSLNELKKFLKSKVDQNSPSFPDQKIPLKSGLIENISKARSGYSLTLINDNQKTNIAVNLFSESYIVNGKNFNDYKKLLEVLNNSVNPRSLDFDHQSLNELKKFLESKI